MGCDPDCPLPEGSQADPPEPPFAEWDYDSGSDMYFRHASETELEVHGWEAGTILFTAPTIVAGLTNGSSTVSLGVPLTNVASGEIDIDVLSLSLHRTRNDMWFSQTEILAVGPLTHGFRPEFHLYLPSWVDFEQLRPPRGLDMFVWAFGDSHGGVALQGITPDRNFTVIGPSTKLWLETLPPDEEGVLVLTAEMNATGFDDLLDHWVGVISTFCGPADCEIDPPSVDPGNCGDCVDNDLDSDIDLEDVACQHNEDYGCLAVPAHTHRYENAKQFAILPDIAWCTQMAQDGMPWQAALQMTGTSAAGLINAIPLALAWMHDQELEEAVEIPDDRPAIRYVFSACVVATDLEAANDCIDDEQDCPAVYHLGGVGHQIDLEDEDNYEDYMIGLWHQFEEASEAMAGEGYLPKPVAMVASLYSGSLIDSSLGLEYQGIPVGIAAGIVAASTPNDEEGAVIIEVSTNPFLRLAHELGHTLGLSHTDAIGSPVNMAGFMTFIDPLPVALLGPSENPSDGYAVSNQWANWAARIGHKQIPRPNGFRYVEE